MNNNQSLRLPLRWLWLRMGLAVGLLIPALVLLMLLTWPFVTAWGVLKGTAYLVLRMLSTAIDIVNDNK